MSLTPKQKRYTLSSPQGIEPLHSALYALLAAMGVWFLGLYGFFVQQAWISAGLLFVFGLLSSAYMGAQIVRADRFSLSDADCKLALFQFYLDPALVIIDRIKKFK